MKIATLSEAEALLTQAEKRNPTPWVSHSRYVAVAAQKIAERHPQLDPETAYILGLLHDIGRQEGWTAQRHVIDGYNFMMGIGYDDAARISMTHSFPVQNAKAAGSKWDCSPDEYDFAVNYLAQIEYNLYDKLLQLCDALALPEGCCLLEKRFVDVVLRHGFNDFTLPRWRATFAIKEEFEQEIGCSIYELLPNVAETTFELTK